MSSFPYFSAFFLPIPNQSQFIVPTFSTFPTFPNHTMSSHFQNFQKFHFLNQQLMLSLPFNELPFPHSFSYLSMSFHSHSFSYFSYLSMSSHSHSFSYFSYLSLSTHSPIYFPILFLPFNEPPFISYLSMSSHSPIHFPTFQ